MTRRAAEVVAEGAFKLRALSFPVIIHRLPHNNLYRKTSVLEI
jgi:hypothetical protein